MGAWGYKNFENDTALDFIGMLQDDNIDSKELFTAINAVAGIVNKEDPEYGPDSDDSCNCLAAIELIAAAKGNPSDDLPAEAKDWLQKHNPIDIKIGGVIGIGGKSVDVVQLSKQAISQIKDNSELKELGRKARILKIGWVF